MSYFLTKKGQRVTVFSPISRQELGAIPSPDDWEDREFFLTEAAYQEIRLMASEAFDDQSPDYVLGYVSGFNSCVDQLRLLFQNDEDQETAWNRLVLLLAEAARFVTQDQAIDESEYIQVSTPTSSTEIN